MTSPYLSRPLRSLAEVMAEREKRIVFVPCDACNGEGRIVEEGPDYEGRDGNCYRDLLVDEPCPYCGGAGGEEQEIEALPIEQAELPP